MQKLTMWTCVLALGACATTDIDNQPETAEAAQSVLGTPEGNDEFGNTFAVGDFDGDGFTDLAVGAPGEAPGSNVHTGAVMIYRGSPSGLFAWDTIAETDLNPGFSAGGDSFGVALAAADLDGDGIDDLVIGAPRSHTANRNVRCGVTYVMWGRSGVGPSRTAPAVIDQPTAVRTGGDGFGTAFATGSLWGTGHADLAVSAPGASTNGWVATFSFTQPANANQVHPMTYHGGVGSLTADPAANFGRSLAITNIDNAGAADLIVGAPYDDNHPGEVHFFRRSGSGFGSGIKLRSSQTGDHFGWAMVRGWFDGFRYPNNDPRNELAISAPHRDGWQGKVFIYSADISGGGFSLVQDDNFGSNRGGLAVENQQEFGFSLAANAMDSVDNDLTDLVVGIPNRESLVPSFGAATVLKGHEGAMVSGQIVTWILATNGSHTEIPSGGMFADALGSAVAVGRFDHVNGADVVVGMPNRPVHGEGAASAGAFLEYKQDGDGAQSLRKYWDEGSPN